MKKKLNYERHFQKSINPPKKQGKVKVKGVVCLSYINNSKNKLLHISYVHRYSSAVAKNRDGIRAILYFICLLLLFYFLSTLHSGPCLKVIDTSKRYFHFFKEFKKKII